MDDKAINEYVNSLPKPVQDLVFGGTWEDKTIEIGKKYGLKDDQIDQLENIVVLVLIGIEKPETFLDTIISDLGISKLLAEQIVNDLENRVFEYALKQIEGKNTNEPKINTSASKLPEIKPSNLPALEEGEVSKPYVPQRSSPNTLKPIEPTQKPYGVPRFGMAQIEPKVKVINMNQNKPSSPQNMMDGKLQNITTNMAPKPEIEKPPQNMPTTKYASDPYREPLQ